MCTRQGSDHTFHHRPLLLLLLLLLAFTSSIRVLVWRNQQQKQKIKADRHATLWECPVLSFFCRIQKKTLLWLPFKNCCCCCCCINCWWWPSDTEKEKCLFLNVILAKEKGLLCKDNKWLREGIPRNLDYTTEQQTKNAHASSSYLATNLRTCCCTLLL